MSILNSVKHACGLTPENTVFDPDIILHINSVFATLNQLGLGPTEGFEIEDETSMWSEFTLSDPRINSVKSLMYIRVRLLFDPPETSYAREALKKQADEIQWRLNAFREEQVCPNPQPIL